MKINIKTLALALMLLLVLISISIITDINKQKQIDEFKKADNESIDYWKNFSGLNATYVIFHNSLEYKNAFNLSNAPVEQFCEENNMTYFLGNIYQSWGCVDNGGEKHYYTVSYKEGYWNIGNKSYIAEWD